MAVRILAVPDAPEYRELRLRALREFPEAFTSSHEEESVKPLAWYEERLAGPASTFWGAFEEGRLCGVVGLEREGRVKNRHKAMVIGMYVAPQQAGRGLGQALLGALVASARREGLELLVLTVTVGNGVAQRLYERAGFVSFGIEPRAIKVAGRPYAKNHMYLELAPS